jgi:hypothetical protein
LQELDHIDATVWLAVSMIVVRASQFLLLYQYSSDVRVRTILYRIL